MEISREIITRTASRLFHKSGVRNISIDEICSDLRISKKTFYLHFQQKEEVIAAVIEDIHRTHMEKFEKNLKNKNAIDSLIYIIRELRKNADCEPHQLWFDIQKYYPRVFEEHHNKQTSMMRAGFEQNLRQGMDEGYYRVDLDVEMVSFFHSVQIKNTFVMMQEHEKKFTKKRMMDFYIDLILHLIANEKGMQYLKENYYNDISK